MFVGCVSLKEIELSSFKINEYTDIFEMLIAIRMPCNLKCKDDRIIEEFNDRRLK